jgi:hypothetical protein
MSNYNFQDRVTGVNTTAVNGNIEPVIRGDILVFSNGVVGKVLGVATSCGYYGMAMIFYPAGPDGRSEPCSHPQSLQHSVKLTGARMFKAKFGNDKLGFKQGDPIVSYRKRYFQCLPVYGFNSELTQSVQHYFSA